MDEVIRALGNHVEFEGGILKVERTPAGTWVVDMTSNAGHFTVTATTIQQGLHRMAGAVR